MADGGGYCRDCSPSSPKRRAWESRPTLKITATLIHPLSGIRRASRRLAVGRISEGTRKKKE